jgi:AP-2 complex subunit mu-1
VFCLSCLSVSRRELIIVEVNDFGYPQNMDAESLKSYITTETFRSEMTTKGDSSQITIQATGAMPWRRADIRYRRNEAFMDVIEKVNLLMSSSGTVLRADVNGQIMMRAFLSGTPECSFSLNDSLTIDEPSESTYVYIKFTQSNCFKWLGSQ